MAKQEKMFAIIERWQRSGLTKAAFARDAGLSINTFHYWCRRYDEEGTATTPAFVEVASDLPVALSRRGEPRLRLEFPDGLSITVY